MHKNPQKRSTKRVGRAVGRTAERRTPPAPANGRRAERQTPPAPRTEGERLLRAVPLSLAAIATRTRSSRAAVHDWRARSKRPDAAARVRLQAAFGIPRLAWELRPDAAGAAATSTPATPDAAGAAAISTPATPDAATSTPATPPADALAGPAADVPRASTLEQVVELLNGVRELRNNDGLDTSTRTRAADTEARVLALKRRIELDLEVTEERFVQSAVWRRFRTRLMRVLVNHPDVARDVCAALG
jgi:hypothetical protein